MLFFPFFFFLKCSGPLQRLAAEVNRRKKSRQCGICVPTCVTWCTHFLVMLDKFENCDLTKYCSCDCSKYDYLRVYKRFTALSDDA